MGRMADKVVIVTGGARGLGRAAALAFAREAGRVVIADVATEAATEVVRRIERSGGTALFVPTDVSDAGQVERLIEVAVDRFGRIDCALNAAADRSESLRRLSEFDSEQFDRCIDVALKGVWLCMKYEIRQMLAQSPAAGRVVNVSSVNGLGGAPWRAVYAAAKAGVLALTKSGALDYARQQIQINALVPGMLETDSRQETLAGLGLDDEARQKLESLQLSLVPSGRLGQPDELAELAVWLFSEAPTYLTGATLVVDGGLTAPWR